MRELVAAAIAVVSLSATQAFAADLPVPSQGPLADYPRVGTDYVRAPIPIYNWGGGYLGINGGYGFGSSTWTGALGGTTGFGPGGFLIGGTIGANVQYGEFVLGFEADGGWMNLSGTSGVGCGSFGVPAFSCETKSDWLSTARVRVGYAFNRILLYGTAGGAAGSVQAGTSPADPVGTASFNDSTQYGWTAGAGIEFALAPNWTAKVEYLFIDLTNGSCTTACNYVSGGTIVTPSISVSFTENLVRAGINYKFGF